MLQALFITAGMSFILGMAAQYAIGTHFLPNRHQIYTWIFRLRNHRLLGEPCDVDQILDRKGYSLGYSYKRKAAAWVSYIVTQASASVNVERGDKFYTDTDIPVVYQVSPDIYRNSGYDKGHLAPSAEIDYSRESNDETFAMSNIVFQHPKFNRQAWGALEGWVRKWTEKKGKLSIIAGPMYTRDSQKIKDIPVPTAFFKVIYAHDHHQAIGFVFPNQAVSAKHLWDYALTVESVENETGYVFFKRLPETERVLITQNVNLDWWRAS